MGKRFSIYFICGDGVKSKEAARITSELTEGRILVHSGGIVPFEKNAARYDIAWLAKANIVICILEEDNKDCPFFPPGVKNKCWRISHASQTFNGTMKAHVMELLTENHIPYPNE